MRNNDACWTFLKNLRALRYDKMWHGKRIIVGDLELMLRWDEVAPSWIFFYMGVGFIWFHVTPICLPTLARLGNWPARSGSPEWCTGHVCSLCAWPIVVAELSFGLFVQTWHGLACSGVARNLWQIESNWERSRKTAAPRVFGALGS